MSSRALPAYADLRVAYPRPVAGHPSPAGWYRQAGMNIDHIFASHYIAGSTSHSGSWEAIPAWRGITPKDGAWDRVSYIQIGQICYLYAKCFVASMDTVETGITPPIPPAASLIAAPVGHGTYVGSTTHQFVPIVEGTDIMFYTVTPDAGPLRDTVPVTQAADDSIRLVLKYRVGDPGRNRLTPLTHAPESQYPVLSSSS